MQHIDFSVSKSKIASLELCFAPPYGIGFKMNCWWFSVFFLVLSCTFVAGEYSGRPRRHQIEQSRQDDNNYLMKQLAKFMEEQARTRFHQQMNHQHHQKQNSIPQEITGPGFSFVLPQMSKADFNRETNEPIQFAVPPFDSRYYENNEGEELADDFDETRRVSSDLTADIKNKILIPPPMHVHESGTSDKILHRAQQLKARTTQASPDVMQKPMQVELDNTMSLYIVALIAGLSCAFSTGLVALVLMYWTMQRKNKSADTCDYACDYGVIGPRSKNLENSQVAMGDKKLAHSAQMFHYQHQKQQIIAMENRNAELNHDEENDSDDNENDFTVYECPGLAEWDSGMEVKNPLFSEETPATKTDKAQPPNKAAANQK